MLPTFVPQDTSELFVEFLDKLVINHYGILFPRRKTSPVDIDFLLANAMLGKFLFYSLRKQSFPEEEFNTYPLKVRLATGMNKEKYEGWKKKDRIGAIISYCEAIDSLAYRSASAKTEATYLLICPMVTHRVEIEEYAFFLLYQNRPQSISGVQSVD